MPSRKQKPAKLSRYEQYELEWRGRSLEALQQEYEHQDSVVTGNIAGTGVATLAAPLTMGLSLVAVVGTGPALHIARKKRTISRTPKDATDRTVSDRFTANEHKRLI